MKNLDELCIGDIVMPKNYHKNSTNQFECIVTDIEIYPTGISKPKYRKRALIEPLNPNDTLIRDHYKTDNWYNVSALNFVRRGSKKVKVKRVK